MKIVQYTKNIAELANRFDCGNIVLNNFLRDGSALDKNQGITYVMLSDNDNFIIGYYNIEAGRVDQAEQIHGQMFYKPMGGAININYLAIHKKFQGMQIAEENGRKIYLVDFLLRDCENRILELSQKVGVAFITLYSTEQGYHLYHERNSYEEFEDDMNTFVQEGDKSCYKLYKCVEDIV